ncbi:MAG: sigma-70 family RNA polymerase sigma factor, partial [Pseudolysinimonas sp.]
MNGTDSPKLTASDETLIEQTRTGDQRAFAELWRRHYRSGARVARQFTSSIDSDDLVSEAYTRIYQRVLAGGGPTGAFRPYLYTTIRNLASTWGAASRDVQVDDISEFADPVTSEDPAAIALDKTLTARAFRSLPDRWQSVLWYTEVEGMDPHEVAPLLGMTANGVAALSYRAREGLRKAWLQAHINDESASGECRWTISRIGDNARHGLSTRDSERIAFHLATCAKCAIISEEVDEVGSRLAMVMIPLILGGVVGGAFLASFGGAASSAMAATAIPAVPTIAGAGAGVAATGAGIGAATGPVAFVGTLAIAVAIGGAVIVGAPAVTSPETSQASSTTTPSTGDSATEGTSVTEDAPGEPVRADDPANILPPGVGTVVDGVATGVGQVVDGVVGGVVNPLLGTIAPDVVAANITLSGHGVPGATVTATIAGTVYASTTIAADGSFSLVISGAPDGSTV